MRIMATIPPIMAPVLLAESVGPAFGGGVELGISRHSPSLNDENFY